MKTPDTSRDYWRQTLTAGGFTAIPRWTRAPRTGVAEHESAVPAGLVTALRRLAADVDVPFNAVLLAAHAKVLAALTGERGVVTGYVAIDGRRPLPCRLTTDSESWRALLLDSCRAETDLLSHRDFPVDELRSQLGLRAPAFETVFDPASGGGGDLSGGNVLRVGVHRQGARLRLRLWYRADAIDAGCAARIAGYHLTALTLIAADPDADHRAQSLLSADELAFQIDRLAGPRRQLPDRRLHELFEQQVRDRPEAIAAVHGDRRWSYGELNARANRIGRALRARGLGDEGVVAVVTERNLDWLAAVLAVFKAGGVYLPIEPHFPADRVATMLARAGCRLVLTEAGSTATLDRALPSMTDVDTLLIGAAYEEEHPDGDLDVAVAADQLAYIYFTSGSTGEPKGAMCEHAGLLDHLIAKIGDLQLGERQVVAQIAPQCFDISLWQLVAGLVAGGRTLIVEQEVILDVERFVDTIVDGRVAVLQVVPSYLEALLTYLEQHPRPLPELRCVSVTGEALTWELARRWFATTPDIELVNAYGLTETSDDTNHHVLDRAPDDGRVPLGRPINNVHVYVVDERLSPVPLGAPGTIAFSGVCVGRGYVNDPTRTGACYLSDPHRPGERLYRGGDDGRWLPDGTLEFLGRRDTQVKLRGFRIEIGEVENALLRAPGVRHGAIVAVARAGQDKRLVAFYTGSRPLAVDELRRWLGASLPDYMVPTAFHRCEDLPLTANGKIDRVTLATMAGDLDVVPDDGQMPRTPSERRLAAAWADVLGLPVDQIGRAAHFFDRGGTSLAAVKLVIALDRAVSLKDVTGHPVLCDLALLIERGSERRSGLLQPLSEPDAEPSASLVCFAHAGGNAVNFQPMASALRGSGVAVHAVELPGHDLAVDGEPLAPLATVVEQVVDEITAEGLPGVMLWGHSSGTAFAVEAARMLHGRGVDVGRIFLAAQLPGDAASRLAAITDLTARSDAELIATLGAAGGYAELAELDATRAGHVAAAYRHDCLAAHRALAAMLQHPPAMPLSAPVTVVVAADDPSTAGAHRRYGEWRIVADHVDLHELADGGHFFLRTRPEAAARLVRRLAGRSTPLLTSV